MHVDARHTLTPLTTTQRAMLLQDLQEARVQSRSAPGGGNRKMSYLAAWDVRRTLIRVFGFGGWTNTIEESKIIKVETDLPRPNGRATPFRVTAQVTTGLYIHQLGAIYMGVAAASQSGSDIGEVADFAIKTADSDAFKRAAMNLGTQFGLSLYNNGQTQDVVNQVLAPDQNARAMRTRTIEEDRIKTLLEAAEMDSAAGVVIDIDALHEAMNGNVLGDTDAEFGGNDEPQQQQTAQQVRQTVQNSGQPQTPPPSRGALDAVGEAFKQ